MPAVRICDTIQGECRTGLRSKVVDDRPPAADGCRLSAVGRRPSA